MRESILDILNLRKDEVIRMIWVKECHEATFYLEKHNDHTFQMSHKPYSTNPIPLKRLTAGKGHDYDQR
jgi:hypothetical protein